MNDNRRDILSAVVERGKIGVRELSERLNLSQVTVRKQLDALAAMGLLRREHGCAIAGSSDDVANRLALNYDIKKRIAERAAQLVNEGEAVMIESGSSCALLAEELAENRRSVSIITNSAFIANRIRGKSAQIILLGGEYQSASQVNVGPLTEKCAASYSVDKLFVGADGFDGGFMGVDLMRSEAVRAMAKRAKRVYVLTDSSKFSRRGVVALLPCESVFCVVTDSGISDEARARLTKSNIEIIIV